MTQINLEIKEKLLSLNKWSRPGKADEYGHTRKKTKAVVLHWTANPQQMAQGVWDWFAGRKNGKTGFGSTHFIIDFDGSITQCVPEEELTYQVGSKTYTEYGQKISSYPNDSVIGMEMCVLNSEGEYTEATWDSAVILSALLLQEYGIDVEEALTTHHAIVGWKDCPKWFVQYPKELERFREEVKDLIKYGLYGVVPKSTVALHTKKDNKLDFKATYNIESRVKLIGLFHGMIHIEIPEVGIRGYVDPKRISILYESKGETSYVG